LNFDHLALPLHPFSSVSVALPIPLIAVPSFVSSHSLRERQVLVNFPPMAVL